MLILILICNFGCRKAGKKAQTWLMYSLKALLCSHYLHSRPFSGGESAKPETVCAS